MDAAQFNEVLQEQIDRVMAILETKADEYATHDRLHNFKTCATLEGVTPTKALAGLMAKHTVSIYDMIRTGNHFDLAVWDEKITDHINYLILLRALVIEEENRLLVSDDV